MMQHSTETSTARPVMSEHAFRRAQQRGAAFELIAFVWRHHDVALHAGEGCETLRISRKAISDLANSGVPRALLERARRIALVVRTDTGQIVTVLRDCVGRTGRRYRRQYPTRKGRLATWRSRHPY